VRRIPATREVPERVLRSRAGFTDPAKHLPGKPLILPFAGHLGARDFTSKTNRLYGNVIHNWYSVGVRRPVGPDVVFVATPTRLWQSPMG
jgi:hypothetical protein